MSLPRRTNGIDYRFADESDSLKIWLFINDLADDIGKSDVVVSSVDDIREILFIKNVGRAVIAEEDGKSVGLLLYYYTFSTFRGVIGLFIEDLIVSKSHRKRGIGKELLDISLELAGSGYVEWKCLRYNISAQKFYDTISGKYLDEWMTYRKEGISKE
ncbi:MAG: GNAT family N-acetyltransferase [Prevotella sp.]